MRVAVIGGKLQGVEATYLAHKAGWEVVVIDKEPHVPAEGLCDHFYNFDVTHERETIQILKNIDLIIPALEEKTVLAYLHQLTTQEGVPFAFDPAAYAVSSSKIRSNELFSRLGLPTPVPWPKASFPYILKPSNSSGSRGVRRINSADELKSITGRPGPPEEWVLEEFLDGPSFSIEILGHHGNYQALQVTDLETDAFYDCKRVRTPTILRKEQVQSLKHMGLVLARALKLRGIMDVEVISHQQSLKVIEVDARLPSQTPTVVYLSTGVNMIELLKEIFLRGASLNPQDVRSQKGVVYEHVMVSPGRMEFSGEHIMADAGPVRLMQNFFGADEAITNYFPEKHSWVATLMIVAPNRDEAWAKRHGVIEAIKEEYHLETYADPSPLSN